MSDHNTKRQGRGRKRTGLKKTADIESSESFLSRSSKHRRCKNTMKESDPSPERSNPPEQQGNDTPNEQLAAAAAEGGKAKTKFHNSRPKDHKHRNRIAGIGS